MFVDHVAVLTKDRPLSVVPIIVNYYTGSVNRPIKKQGSHGQGLLITVFVLCLLDSSNYVVVPAAGITCVPKSRLGDPAFV